MSSTRLPGKVLKEVSGRPMLQYTLERVALAQSADAVVVATSDEASDDPIAVFCAQVGASCFRGSLTDVAGRFVAAANAYSFEAFVRVCGDSPLTDPTVMTTAIQAFRSGTYDLVTNTFPRSFPVGCSVEVVRTAVFRQAYGRMREPADLEHVTRYYYHHPADFRIKNFSAPEDRSAEQLAVDTPEDWARFERIVQQMDRAHTTYGYEEILAMCQRLGAHAVAGKH